MVKYCSTPYYIIVDNNGIGDIEIICIEDITYISAY